MVDKSIVTISLDFELHFGLRKNTIEYYNLHKLGFFTKEKYLKRINKLINLIMENEIRMTWAILTKMLTSDDDLCKSVVGELQDLVDIGQDVCSHSHTHCEYSSITKDLAQRDLQLSIKLLRKVLGVNTKCFIYPRSKIRYIDVLIENGIEVTRTPPWNVYGIGIVSLIDERMYVRKIISKLMNVSSGYMHKFIIKRKRVVMVPYSIHIFHATRYSVRNQVVRCFRILDRIVKQGGILHIVLHDYSLITEEDLNIFATLIRKISNLRRRKALTVLPLSKYSRFIPVNVGGEEED